MTKSQPLVSFVVLSWNTLQDTKICIDNLLSLSYKNSEVIVVDNGSTDGSKDFLSKKDGITYIDLPKNMGFTGGQIAALPYCKGEYIALINSDAVIARDWTEVCLDVFSENTKAAVVGGRAYVWTHPNDAFNTELPFYSYQKVDPTLGYASTFQSGDKRTVVDSISGAAVMLSREAIDKVGYFDDRFFAYFEETDLFARFQRVGYQIIYEPKAHAWHQIAKSTKSKPYFYLYHMHRNRFMYGFKNFDDAWSFAGRYLFNGLAATFRSLNNDSLDDKARRDALLWNLRNFFRTKSDRKKVLSLGSTYTKLLYLHEPADDITVIIPSYNYATYIIEAIDSANNQTLRPFRIVVIDDGSTDNSVELAKKRAGVEVISKRNEGVVPTKNHGMSLVTTTWTVFLDADDVLEPNYLQETYKTAVKEHADVVYTDMEYTGAQSGRFEAQEYSLQRLLEGNFVHNSALINTSFLRRINGYKEEMTKGYEDWELYLSLAEADAKFAYNTTTHLNYRQHAGSLGRNLSAKTDAEELWQTALELHAPLKQKLKQQKKIHKLFFRQIKQNPELPIIMILAIPYALFKGIFGYIFLARHSYIHFIRNHLHKKSLKKKGLIRENSHT